MISRRRALSSALSTLFLAPAFIKTPGLLMPVSTRVRPLYIDQQRRYAIWTEPQSFGAVSIDQRIAQMQASDIAFAVLGISIAIIDSQTGAFGPWKPAT